jgi:single-strand DNA-binding protein
MSVNKVILIGFLGSDPEVKTLDSSVKVARVSLATSESYTDKSGKKVENTEWHNLVIWRGLADVVEKYTKKGSQIYVEGKLKTSSYEKDSVKHYRTDIVVDNLRLLDRKQELASNETTSNFPTMDLGTPQQGMIYHSK